MPKKNLYLTPAQLKAELEKCLNCPNKPCMKACPAGCSPQEFIALAKKGEYKEAVASICSKNPLGQVCGLACPDKFCMKACTRQYIDFALNIPKIQATLLANYRTEKKDYNVSLNGHKAAVIGAGPAGLGCASTLCSLGWNVDIFEASDKIGGAINLIPEDRLPRMAIESDWNFLYDKNRMNLFLNTKIDNPADLFDKGYDGVILAIGEPNAVSLGIENENLAVSYKDYLKRPNDYKSVGQVAVIGGGNVAFDCAITAKNNGATMVEMFVRRKSSDMRISKQEYLELQENGINVTPLTSPEKIEKTDDTFTLFVHKNRFIEGKLQAIPQTKVALPNFSLIITAVGSRCLEKCVDERIVYAGDCLSGGSTIVEAIASGKKAALELNDRFK